MYHFYTREELSDISIFQWLSPIGNLSPTHMALIITSFMMFSLVFLIGQVFSPLLFPSFRKLSRTDRVDWCTRYTSSLHCIGAVGAAIYIILTQPNFGNDPLFDTDVRAEALLCFSIGYFAMDLCVVLLYRLQPIVFLVAHHWISAQGFVIITGYGQGEYFGVVFLLSEATGPFLNMSWMLAKSGYELSQLNFIVKFFTTINWFIFRTLLSIPMLMIGGKIWSLSASSTPYIKFQIGLTLLFLCSINILYFYVVFQELMDLKRRRELSRASKKHERSAINCF